MGEPHMNAIERRADAGTLLAEAEALVRDGRVVDALDRLAAANREQRDPAIEVRLVELRRLAAQTRATGPARSPWPPTYDDPFPDVVGCLPEIALEELTPSVLGGAVVHHGALIVRGMLDTDQAASALDALKCAEAHRNRSEEARDDSWYRPYPTDRAGNTARRNVGERGGTWLADSPASSARILDLLGSNGIVGAVTGHLGERPCFSLQKSTLRHLLPVPNITGWHQDGAFLGPDVRTMNVWIALSPCGSDRPTPGLEVVPKRVGAILSTEGGVGKFAVAPDRVLEVATDDAPPMRPDFLPGDGLLFDERFLHRTSMPAGMTHDRFAIECWLFAPSHGSPEYLSFLV